MSKSLRNAIFLSDDDETIQEKVNAMYTDPLHIRSSDPGHIEGNVPFLYLRIFAKNEHFSEYCKDYQSLDEMEEHYLRGGLGDNIVKKLLCKILQDLIRPIRECRNTLSNNIELVKQILEMGTIKAYEIGADNIAKIRSRIL
jgi:tryptophanyl-tRNA synthetase